MYLFGQGYYYKKGHNQNMKFSGIGLEVGYYYPILYHWDVDYLPLFGDARFRGNPIYGGHLEFHIRDGVYLKGSGNVWWDKVQTETATVFNVTRNDLIRLSFASATLSLNYEVQWKKRYYPYIGLGAAITQILVRRTYNYPGRAPESTVQVAGPIMPVGTVGMRYTINGNFDLGVEGRLNYGRFWHEQQSVQNEGQIDNMKISFAGPLLMATMTYRFDSRYFRRKIGKYSSNPGTTFKR